MVNAKKAYILELSEEEREALIEILSNFDQYSTSSGSAYALSNELKKVLYEVRD